MNTEQLQKMATAPGFIAALDQSGGSTPKALRLYGLEESTYSGEAEMFDLIHQMRTRIMTSSAFTGERILGAILFEMTMERQVEGMGAAEYLWETKRVVPFLKVDKGLADEADGARVMKPIPDLDDLLTRARAHGVFGTKMRSVIMLANPAGIGAVVAQQFGIGLQILARGLVPIIEPEIDIHSPQKAAAEDMLRSALIGELDMLGPDQRVMLKLTLPEQDGHLTPLVEHPRVLRVLDQGRQVPVLLGERQLEHHPLVGAEHVQLADQRGTQHVLGRGLLRGVDVDLGLDDRHQPAREDLQPDAELLRDDGADSGGVRERDHRAHLGAEDAVGPGPRQQVVEVGDRLHHPCAVRLVRQALVDLEERDDPLRLPQVLGRAHALDQSGGSTPKALRLYGLEDSAYSGEAEMFDLLHQTRTRIMTSPAFTGERILGAILFEMTMERQVEGMGAAEYLWETKRVVPFLKVDKGLADEADGARVMKPIPDLDDLLTRAR